MMFRSVMPVLLLLIPLLRSVESAHTMRACGQPLMELLSMACRNGYNSLFSKRGSLGLFDYEDHLTDLDSSEAHHMNSLSGIRRDWRGIVDDCCHKPCTWDTLRSYCRL
ncbi:probable insulin-like peptide 5 [Drosophila teissieri]|uniref:probable insulin-like peptide 5 n=1 Tax=Drosophila teissieri TaxID=7243 RepID=UPI001CBA5BA0|nr:probable insulin-like peptide 5 [Drosophila teissieri]